MASRREAVAMIAVGTAAAVAGWYFAPRSRPVPDSADAASLLAARWQDLDGKPRSVLEWKGQVLVCNFWATWCAPCREEIPALGRIHAKFSPKSVEILGIAVDKASNVVEFMRELKILYPVVLGDANSIELMRRLGNSSGGLPFTVILDRQGRLAYRKLGSISESELEANLASIT
jgi:thiol-disulfide isomerase/thioredoxin